jgi:hypothetical protein
MRRWRLSLLTACHDAEKALLRNAVGSRNNSRWLAAAWAAIRKNKNRFCAENYGIFDAESDTVRRSQAMK